MSKTVFVISGRAWYNDVERSEKVKGGMEMATLADIIEEYIKQLMARTGGEAIEIRRRDVAQQFECVPSQINYVLETRFTPQRGYYVESRRGGGGYIRITRTFVRRNVVSFGQIAEEIGGRIGRERAEALLDRLEEMGLLPEAKSALIRGALRHETAGIEPPQSEVIRAKLLRGMLLVALHDQRSNRP